MKARSRRSLQLRQEKERIERERIERESRRNDDDDEGKGHNIPQSIFDKRHLFEK